MIERMIRYLGEVPCCKRCGKPPLLFMSQGNITKAIVGGISTQYHYECPRCGVKTSKYPSVQEANCGWDGVNIAPVVSEAA